MPWRVRYFPDVRKNHIVARESLRKMASYTEIRFSKSSKRNNNSAERIETYRTNSIETLDISARLETRSIVWPTGITSGDTASSTKTRREQGAYSYLVVDAIFPHPSPLKSSYPHTPSRRGLSRPPGVAARCSLMRASRSSNDERDFD